MSRPQLMSDLQCPARVIVVGRCADQVRWPASLRIAAVYADRSGRDAASRVAKRLQVVTGEVPDQCSPEEAATAIADLFRGETVLVVLGGDAPRLISAPDVGADQATMSPTHALVIHVDSDGSRTETLQLDPAT